MLGPVESWALANSGPAELWALANFELWRLWFVPWLVTALASRELWAHNALWDLANFGL